MGRPKKRRRGGEADEPTEQPGENQIDYTNIFDEFRDMPDFSGLGPIPPPLLHDGQSSIGSAGHGAMTPAQLDLDHVNPFEIQLNQDLG
jgi:hypothetical protein